MREYMVEVKDAETRDQTLTTNNSNLISQIDKALDKDSSQKPVVRKAKAFVILTALINNIDSKDVTKEQIEAVTE